MFKDAIAKLQKSDKLSTGLFRPFLIMELVGMNAVRLELPDNMGLHPAVDAIHTTPFAEQPNEISQPLTTRPDPVPESGGQLHYKVDEHLKYRKRGRGYQLLTLLKGTPRHKADWQPTKYFVDADGTSTVAFLKYIWEKDLLPHLRTN